MNQEDDAKEGRYWPLQGAIIFAMMLYEAPFTQIRTIDVVCIIIITLTQMSICTQSYQNIIKSESKREMYAKRAMIHILVSHFILIATPSLKYAPLIPLAPATYIALALNRVRPNNQGGKTT